MNHFRLLGLIVAVAALIVASCGVVTPESLALATDQIEPTTVRIATPRIAGLESQIAVWQREHPTVEVDVIVQSADDHDEWLAAGADPNAIPGSAGPVDIVAFDATSSPTARILNDTFLDLTNTDLHDRADEFFEGLWVEGINIDGELIAVPVDVDAQALLIRSDLAGPTVTTALQNANDWCDIIEAGNGFVDSTGKAFFADGEEVLRAILSQSRSSWVSIQGTPEPELIDELSYAWSIAMLAVGEEPVAEDPCNLGRTETISRDLTPGGMIWRAEIASDDFGAVISRWSERSRISQANPERSGDWVAIPLPVDSPTAGAGTSSEGGLYFGIAATSDRANIAVDLLATITDPLVQRNTFNNGLGPLPATISAYTDGTVSAGSDPFFGGSQTIGAVYTEAVEGRPSGLANPQRQVVIDAMVEALARVQGELETPEQAWDHASVAIQNRLSAR